MSTSLRPSFVLRAPERCIAIACVAVASILGWSGPAAAQEKQVTQLVGLTDNVVDLNDVKNNVNQLRMLQGKMIPIVGNPFNQAAAADFDKFYLAKLAELTWPTSLVIEQKREDWKRKLFNPPGMHVDWHDRANQLLVKNLPALIADEQILLQARHNYVILLGQLDKIEFKLSEHPAVPLPEATPLLIAVLNKPDMAETLRIGAWMGLVRQAELQISQQARQSVIAETVKFVAARKPLAGFSTDGHHWSRKCALQALTGLAKTGTDVGKPETVKALHDIIADPAEPLFLRRDAALALGHLDSAALNNNQVKPPELMKALANLTLEVMRAGSAVSPASDLKLNKAEDVFPPPTDETKGLFGHGVAYHLNCIAIALGGRAGGKGLKSVPGLDGPTGKQVPVLLGHIDPVVNTLTFPTTSSLKMTTELQKAKPVIEKFVQDNGLQQVAAAAAAAAPPPAGNGNGNE